MRKRLLLTLVISLIGILSVQSQEKFAAIDIDCMGTGISANGKYIVGVSTNLVDENGIYYESFLYNVETGKQDWLTDFNGKDYTGTGSFSDVSDQGVIVGTFRNMDLPFVTGEGISTFLNTAGVWKNGQLTSLGTGTYKLSEFNHGNDGSFGAAISSDGTIVVGRITIDNSYAFPCLWKYDDSKSEWTFTQLDLPVDAVGGKATDISADGKIIVGTIWYSHAEKAAYWQNGECHLIEGAGEDEEFNNEWNYNSAQSISPNGKYVAFIFNKRYPAVFDIEKQTYEKLEKAIDSFEVKGLAVSNNGNAIGSYSYGGLLQGKLWQRPFWYSQKDNRTLGFDYFMSLYSPGIKPPFTFLYEEQTLAYPCAVSADGTVVLGNYNTIVPLGGRPECWVLCTNEQNIEIPEITEQVKARSLDLRQVLVSWDKNEKRYEGLELQAYAIYCNGEKIGEVPHGSSIAPGSFSKAPDDHMILSFLHQDVTPGYPKYSVANIYKVKSTGVLIESPKSEPVTVTVSDTYSLPFYDGFDSGSTTTNYWTEEVSTGQSTSSVWNVWPYFGLIDKALFGKNFANTPYISTITTRPMDATHEENVRVSFAIRYELINIPDQPLEGDSLSVDGTIDRGDNWEEMATYSLADITVNWNLLKVDLSQKVAGKVFQVRLRMHGQGLALYNFVFDLFEVGANPEKKAPEGLTGHWDSENVNLVWQNSYNAYQLNYLTDDQYALCIGDEGNTFIAANSFDEKDLEIYNGKYLTSIRAYINHDFNIENTKDTHAAVVVYENGKLIREQELEYIDYNEENIVILNEPVRIDATKELKIGLKIFDYDARQIPITYQHTLDCVTGKSDLFSQDDGKTWQTLLNYYANITGKEKDGYCCWRISGDVTDKQAIESDIINDKDLLGYNIYRNGDKLNKKIIYRQQPRFIDIEPLDQASYEVVAFYLDGSVSHVSNAFIYNKGMSIENGQADHQVIIYPNPATDYVKIDGKFDKVTLFDINGQTLKKTNECFFSVSDLPIGIYILKVESGKKIETTKLVVKR